MMLREIYKYVLTVCLCGVVSVLCAQTKVERDYLRSGNRLYRDSLYTKAEVDYRKALENNSRFPQAYFNLGNALLWQQKPKEAMEAYEKGTKVETNKKRLASMYHNMGVIFQAQKQFADAIECYKEALRKNPKDDETRYNLVLCQHQLKNSPPQDNGGQENKDGQDQNKEEDKNSDKQDKQENQNKKEEQKKQEQEQQQKQDEMSKENAEQLLNAVMQDEKDTQERINKAKAKPQRRRLEKQW